MNFFDLDFEERDEFCLRWEKDMLRCLDTMRVMPENEIVKDHDNGSEEFPQVNDFISRLDWSGRFPQWAIDLENKTLILHGDWEDGLDIFPDFHGQEGNFLLLLITSHYAQKNVYLCDNFKAEISKFNCPIRGKRFVFHVSDSNPYYSVTGSCLMNKEKDCIYYDTNAQEKEIVFPQGTKSIGYGVYVDSRVEELVLPEGIEDIHMAAFEGCSCLTDIVIPKSVRYIGDLAFDRCSLTDVTISRKCGLGHLAFDEYVKIKRR